MMLYDIHYFKKNGHLLMDYDHNVPGPHKGRAAKGEIARATNVNGDGHVKWFDENGECAAPVWAERVS